MTPEPAGPAAATDLPRRWRPLGVRVAGWFFGSLFVLVSAVMWWSLGAEIRDRIPLRHQLTLLAFALALLVCLHALMRCRVDADERGLLLVNGYRQHRLEWAQVIAAHLPPGAPWVTLDLADGTTASAMGIQGSDGVRARRALEDLRALIDPPAAPGPAPD